MIIGIIWQSLKKILHSICEYFNDKSWLSGQLKSMVISVLLKSGMVKFLTHLHISLIAQFLSDINFILIIFYILIQFKVFIYSP